MFKVPHHCIHFVCKKVMLKILQASLQQHVNQELPDVLAGFRKDRGTRDQIANIRWIIEKAKEFQITSISALLTMPKPLTLDHNKLWKIRQEMGIPDHLTCLLRNLYACQEAIVRSGYGTTDWFQIGKGVHQSCIFSPCLFRRTDVEAETPIFWPPDAKS